jgi:hypothetical protein
MKTRDRQKYEVVIRSITSGDPTEVGKSTRTKKSFSCDAAKVLNKVPDKIRAAKTLTTAKKAFREQYKSPPI